jgi:hypothetical protein
MSVKTHHVSGFQPDPGWRMAAGGELIRGRGDHAVAEKPGSSWSRPRWWILALGGALTITVGAVVTRNVAPTPAPVRPPASAPSPGGGVAADFARLQIGLHATVGLVMRAAGTGPETQVVMGNSDFIGHPAWSTIKVPLVMAAMRQRRIDRPTPPMVSAITESDNAAAESIWESLGDPVTSAAEVDKVLRDTGDPTIVESRKLRPEYSASGQTGWSLTNQATFLSAAACDPRNQPVLDLMGEVTSEQRAWGLGPLPGAKIKGGWGPAPSGRYLVRQIAIMPVGQRGSAVVAMAAEPESGLFADGTLALTQIGDWLRAHLDAVPAAQCHA